MQLLDAILNELKVADYGERQLKINGQKELKIAAYGELKIAAYGELKIAAYGERQRQMSSEGFNETDHSDFWTEMTNLQKAKIIR